MLRHFLVAALFLLVAAPAAGAPLLDVRDPALLAAVEAAGWSLGDVLGTPGAVTTQALAAESPGFRALRDTVAADVAELAATMAQDGRPLEVAPRGETGRVIDMGWFASPIAGFALSGIVNRLDRRDFSNLEGMNDCGEVRLLYRLFYRAEPGRKGEIRASRLPVSLNVVFTVPRPQGGDCALVAARWLAPQPMPTGEAFRDWLLAGPLVRSALTLKQIEINAQIVRLPSGQEPGFGGQAAYLMRAFAALPGEGPAQLREKPLENTPDVDRIRQDAALKAALVDYVKTSLPAIDTGVFHLPDELSAKRAIAFSTFGSARLANHPFTQALEGADLGTHDYAGLGLIRDADGLRERLDNASCAGCHQGGGTAGFHFFGTDNAGATSDYNRVLQGISPHYHAEQPRRAAYVEAVIAGREPNRFRPLSYAPAADWTAGAPHYVPAGTAMACLAGTSGAAFAQGWSCGHGETCQSLSGNSKLGVEIGQCMPARASEVTAGLACLRGEVSSGREPYLDRWREIAQINSFAERPTLSAYSCRPSRIGVPGGLAYRQCSDPDRAFAHIKAGEVPAEVCGLAGGKGFDRCVATGDFAACQQQAMVRGMRPACGRDSFCREDYICQSLPEGLDPAGKLGGQSADEVGFCSPTYFLFQMRIDGHPDPASGGRRKAAVVSR
ncbi:hypothetical protein G3545_12805 [Starkeya sp. ORNL1]|uniref:hypothetical protein n=1 Tax=Starkeya sp. ORNL1 TaxID=2709380 RepID=UPI00146283C5|nr:hypothetical protein [Starkeya sp. ORNL1]QJP14441.1 hypothetical protein G3545_12805 [Starkeya sp. ORNL1]